MEELRLVLDAIKTLGPEAKVAWVWYLVCVHLAPAMFTFTGFMGLLGLIYKLVKRQQDIDNK